MGESNKPFCVKGGECIGNVPTISQLATYIKDYIKNDAYPDGWENDEVNGATRKTIYNALVELTLENLATKNHSDLDNIGSSDHHVKTTASELNLANMNEKSHTSLTGITSNQHHTKTVASELNLADMNEKSYDSLTDKPDFDSYGIGNASDTQVWNNATEKTSDSFTYELKKVIICYKHLKNVRISWEMKGTNELCYQYSKVLIDGQQVGTEFVYEGLTYTTHTVEASNIKPNTNIELWARRGSCGTCYVRNFKINYDEFVDNDP
ncbi:MAG: hypothetical protein ACFFAO_16805 [Candidatus Hermodarchaeota archaeon]